MLQIERILFPTDGSPCAEYAHEKAATLAEHFGAELHVLHVVEKRTNNLDNLSELIEIREEDILKELRIPIPKSKRNELVRREKVTHPSAAGGILQYAGSHDIDLIVMGTHGRRGVKRLLMGSVAEEVVRLAECPVFTVCAREEQHVQIEGGRILVPVDFSKHTDALLQHAQALAEAFQADLDVLHVVEPVSFPSVYGMETDVFNTENVKERSRDALEEQAASLREAGYTVTVHVRSGHPAQGVLNFIDDHDIAMVVIATHGRTGLQRLLIGSVAEKVVRMSSCPVFTVKSFGKALVRDASS